MTATAGDTRCAFGEAHCEGHDAADLREIEAAGETIYHSSDGVRVDVRDERGRLDSDALSVNYQWSSEGGRFYLSTGYEYALSREGAREFMTGLQRLLEVAGNRPDAPHDVPTS